MCQLRRVETQKSLPSQILKLGGSLLLFPDLVNQLGCWWRNLQERDAELMAAPWFVVVGGGTVVDVVRRWDQVHSLSPTHSHRLALSGMQVTARLVAQLMDWPLLAFPVLLDDRGLGNSPPEDGKTLQDNLFSDWWEEVTQLGVDRPIVVDLAEAAGADRQLPESWEVTSDSLAMWLASRVHARRVVLLKAVNPLENPVKIGKIEGLGWVDAFFSRMWSAGPGIQVEIAYFSHCPQVSQVHGVL